MKESLKKLSPLDMWKFVSFQTKGYGLVKLAIIAGAVVTPLSTYLNYIMYAMIIDSLTSRDFLLALNVVIIFSLSVFFAKLILSFCENVCMHFYDPTAFEVKKRTVKKAFDIQYEKSESPEILNDFRRVRTGEQGSGDLRSLLYNINEFYGKMVSILFALVFIVILLTRANLFRGSGLLSLGFLILLVAAFFVMLKVNDVASKILGEKLHESMRSNEHANTIGGYIISLIFNEKSAKYVRIYDMSDYVFKKYEEYLNIGINFASFGRFAGKCMGVTTFSIQVFAGVTYAFIALLALQGNIGIGEIILYAGAVLTLSTNIRDILVLRNQINYCADYLGLYEEFINRPDLDYEGTLPVEKRDDNEYELEFKNVWFKYGGQEEYALRDFSFKFTIGQKLALVGLNGAGKSTVIKLLTRLYEPEKGEILLNGINIWKYDYKEYMGIFSVVFQDFSLYDFPLDENIAGGTDVDSERLQGTIEKSGLTEWVSTLKDGTKTLLFKENGDGVTPSGGEAQKIAIARALYKDAPFVILDEPTAALDPFAEAEVYENFDTLVGDKTAIYISHRMSSCRFCDRIVVIDKGSIAEEGNHESLLARGGIYSELFNTQAQYYTQVEG